MYLYHFNRLLKTFPTRCCMICIEQFWNEKHVKNVPEWPAGNAVLLAFTRFGLKVLAGVGQSQVCVHRARFIRDNLQKVEWRGWNDLPWVLTSTQLNTSMYSLVELGGSAMLEATIGYMCTRHFDVSLGRSIASCDARCIWKCPHRAPCNV